MELHQNTWDKYLCLTHQPNVYGFNDQSNIRKSLLKEKINYCILYFPLKEEITMPNSSFLIPKAAYSIPGNTVLTIQG